MRRRSNPLDAIKIFFNFFRNLFEKDNFENIGFWAFGSIKFVRKERCMFMNLEMKGKFEF